MIKNYTSNSKNTFDAIQKTLITHNAKQIMFEYDEMGKVKTLVFSLKIVGKIVGFKLPARVENVAKIMYGHPLENLNEKYQDQAYRTAWANIRDWLSAQMALIDTEQVKIEEVFLPYAVNRDGQTFFEVTQKMDYLLPSTNDL